MKNPQKPALPAKLALGRERFEKWRSTHKARSRFPEHLWYLAAKLAREYGLNRTAHTLRLDYNCLKNAHGFIRPQRLSRILPTTSVILWKHMLM
jgi:hypothetical protein